MKKAKTKYEIADLNFGKFVIIETNDLFGRKYFEVMDSVGKLGLINKQFPTREEAKLYAKKLEESFISSMD